MSIVVTNNDAQVTPSAKAPVETPEKVEVKSEAASEQVETTDESETSEETLQAKAGDDAESDDESDEAEEPKVEAAPKKVGGAQKKINKLVGKLSAKEQEVEYWKAQALKSAKPENEETRKVDAPKATTEGKPDPNKFDTHEDYVEALADWKVEQKLVARDSKAKEDSLKTDFQKQMKTHVERVNKFAEATPDFHDAIEEIDHIPMSITVQDVILSSDDGPALMYALAKAPKEYARICALPAIAAARELGKFEAQISKTPPKKLEKKITKAPAPLKTVGSKSSGGTPKSLEEAAKAGATEYQRMRMEQMKNKNSSWG